MEKMASLVEKKGDPGPLLVTLTIAGIKVTRILVSTGCAENIISLSTLQELGFKRELVRECHGHVRVGSIGNPLRVVGEMEVLVEMGEYPCQANVVTTFKIVEKILRDNAIVGRSLLYASRASVSVSELRFPTPHGTGVLGGGQPKPKIAEKKGDPGPLFVSLSIAGIKVTRVLVSMCTENIIRLSTLQELGFKMELVRECRGHVRVGFLGDPLRIVGEMEVPVEMGEYPCQATVVTTFKIVDNKTLPFFNAIMGTPLLKVSKALVDVGELRIEFPTPHGTGVLRGDQPEPEPDGVSVVYLM